MKKLILLTVLLSLGCSKNCDDLENAANEQYKNALLRCGSSSAAVV